MVPVDEWQRLAALFPGSQRLASTVELVPASATPEPYGTLLVHNNHMTVIMERFHGSPVDVAVLARRIDVNVYSRAIILARRDNRAVVQFALAQYDLNRLSEAVRNDLLSEQIPLGRVLLNRGVECRIELDAILKMTLAGGLSGHLRAPVGTVTYGRVARILSDDKPTALVIEVSAPISPSRDRSC